MIIIFFFVTNSFFPFQNTIALWPQVLFQRYYCLLSGRMKKRKELGPNLVKV